MNKWSCMIVIGILGLVGIGWLLLGIEIIRSYPSVGAIFIFCLLGIVVGMIILIFAFRYREYWFVKTVRV